MSEYRDLSLVETVRGSFWIVTSSVLVNVFGFTFWLLCSKVVQIKFVGYATTAFSLAFMISALVNFGFVYVILREVPLRGSRVFSATLTTALTVGLVASFILTPLKSIYYGFDIYILLAMVIVVLSLINAILSSTFIALLKPHLYFMISTLMATSKLILIALLTTIFDLNGLAIMLAIVLSSLLACITAFTLIFKLIGFSKFNLDDVKRVLRVGFSNYPQVLSIQLLITTGIALLSLLTRNPVLAAITYIIFMTTLAIAVIPNSLAIASLPVMVRDVNVVDKISSSGVRLGLGVVAPILVLVATLSKLLLNILRPEYAVGWFGLVVAMFSIPLITTCQIAISKLNAEGKLRLVLAMGLVRLLTLLAALPVMVRILDPIVGAVTAFLLSNAITSPIALKQLDKVVAKYLIEVIVTQIAFTILGYVLSTFMWCVYAGLISAILTLIVLNFLGLLTVKDVKFLISTILSTLTRR